MTPAEEGRVREAEFPWPPSNGASILVALGDTWRTAALEPERFFARLPRQGGTRPALLYYLIIGVLVAGASLFWSTIGGARGGMVRERIGYDPGAAVTPLVEFLLTPLVLLIALAVTTVVFHGLLRLLGGTRHGVDTTLRVLCYAHSPMILGVVPLLGTLAGAIWMVVLTIIGLRSAHETDGWKVAIAVILPFALAVVLAAVVVLAILATSAALLVG